MPNLNILGSVGKGEKDFTIERNEGDTYTYFPIPDGGYGYDHAVYEGVTLYDFPLVVTVKKYDTTLYVTYMPSKPPEEKKPAPAGEELIESVGKSCKIYSKYLFGSKFFYLRHDTKGALTAYDDTIQDVRDRVEDFPECQEAVKTPDSVYEEVMQKLTSGLSALSKTFENGIAVANRKLDEMKTSIEEINLSLFDIGRFLGGIDTWFDQKFQGMRNTVIGWIESAMIEILERVLDKEVK